MGFFKFFSIVFNKIGQTDCDSFKGEDRIKNSLDIVSLVD